MSKKKIYLYGHLAEKYPHPIEVEADTVAEAVHSLSTIDELRPANGAPWPVTIKGVTNEIALFSETSLDEIHVYPRTGGGGGRTGLIQVVLGVALVGLAIATGGIAALGLTQGSMILAGGMMALGGLLQMLMPTPDGSEEQESSRYLGASANTVKIGTNITLAYGNNKLGGQYLSFDVDAFDYAGDDDFMYPDDGDPVFSNDGVAHQIGPNVKALLDRDDVGEPVEGTLADLKGVYTEHDRTPVQVVPVNPIFASPVAAPDNIPTSGWNN